MFEKESVFNKNSLQKLPNDFLNVITKNRRKIVKGTQLIIDGLKDEANDSKEFSRIIYHYVANQRISKKEEQLLKKKVADMFKIIGVGIPFMMIPGASILIPFILKFAEQKGIDLIPSNFKEKK
ncbi:MAG: hypothetical protein ACWA42_11005 [Lutibacter sp.]